MIAIPKSIVSEGVLHCKTVSNDVIAVDDDAARHLVLVVLHLA